MKRITSFLTVTAFLLLSPAVYAQQVFEEELGKIIVTATRIGQHDYKITGNVTVIDRDQIESSNAQNIPDILKKVVGVNIYDSGTAKSSVIDIRGFGDTSSRNVLVLLNDRKLNVADISGPDLMQVPIEAIERIEIIRGAGSVLYGDNAVGGVINIITRKGEGEFKGKVKLTYGSYDKRSTGLEVSGKEKEISYYLSSKYNDLRGYRDNSDVLAKDFNARLAYDITEKTSVDVNVGWHEDYQGLPGGLNDSEIVTYGRRGTAYLNDFSDTKDRNFSLGLNINPWPEDMYLGEIVFDYYYRNRDNYSEYNRWGLYHSKRTIDTHGITGKYIFKHDVFNKEVNFVAGIDYYNDKSDILGSSANADDVTIGKNEFGLYTYLQYELLDDLYANMGTRYQRADYEFDDRNTSTKTEKDPTESVNMAGLKYEYAKGSNVHVNVQQTFRFLATDEWYQSAYNPAWGITPGLDTSLDHQKGIQYELGLKHNVKDLFTVSFTPYWIDLKDEIFYDPNAAGNNNYDKTRRRGVDIGCEFNMLDLFDIGFLDKFDVNIDYAHQNAQFNGGMNSKKYIPMVPKNLANVGIKLGFLDNIYFSIFGRYVGARYAINDTANATPMIKPNFVVDTKLSYEKDDVEVFAVVNNIFDKEYDSYVVKSAFSSTKAYYPAPEVNFDFGVNVKF